ncbi:MAG: hypothetical protein ABJC05_04675 [Pyrinomonadaceae bacterium]
MSPVSLKPIVSLLVQYDVIPGLDDPGALPRAVMLRTFGALTRHAARAILKAGPGRPCASATTRSVFNDERKNT